MSARRNAFLDHESSDSSDPDDGYDSEAAEVSKSARVTSSGRSVKRRKLSHSDEDDDDLKSRQIQQPLPTSPIPASSDDRDDEPSQSHTEDHDGAEPMSSLRQAPTDTLGPLATSKRISRDKYKSVHPGVVYLSSLPPYLKPSALRNLLIQRGFHPITRLFLTPASKASAASKKNSRQLYTEGWIEFASKKTARHCAETLNATTVGGKKGGFYHDDLWNMKYLKGMGWSELMAGIREERREEEGRRDEERRTIAQETKRFVEGVEEGKRRQGMKRKKSAKVQNNQAVDGADADVKRTWRQFKVKGKDGSTEQTHKQQAISDEAREVLSKIF